MRASFYELLLWNLRGDFEEGDGMAYIPKEKAYEELKQKTGHDFGYDSEAWENWLDENKEGWRFATLPRPQMSFHEQVQDTIRMLFWPAGKHRKVRRR